MFINSCEEGGEEEILEWLEANAELNSCELLLAVQFPKSAYRMYKNSEIANVMTISIFGPYGGGNGHNDCADAFRHAFWNAINARDTYSSIANAFGSAH